MWLMGTRERPISNLINYLARQKLEEDLFVDKIEMDEIILIPVKTLRDFRGSVIGSGTPDEERQTAKNAVTSRIIEELRTPAHH